MFAPSAQDLLHEETPATAAARSEAPTSPPPPLEFERAFSAEVKATLTQRAKKNLGR